LLILKNFEAGTGVAKSVHAEEEEEEEEEEEVISGTVQ
jgi:hypothetical protein